MIYIALNYLGDKYGTGAQHFFPFDEKQGLGKTEEELLQTGILVESLPIKEVREGKQAILYATKPDKELYYEYEDAPETDTEQLRTDMNEAIMELSMLIAMGGNA